MDHQAFEQRLQREGYGEIERRGMPANESRAEHAHHFDVQALVTAGAITLTCAGAARTYRAGDVFTMTAGTLHAEDVGADGVEYIVGRRH